MIWIFYLIIWGYELDSSFLDLVSPRQDCEAMSGIGENQEFYLVMVRVFLIEYNEVW
jgi:hypothetical protein